MIASYLVTVCIFNSAFFINNLFLFVARQRACGKILSEATLRVQLPEPVGLRHPRRGRRRRQVRQPEVGLRGRPGAARNGRGNLRRSVVGTLVGQHEV